MEGKGCVAVVRRGIGRGHMKEEASGNGWQSGAKAATVGVRKSQFAGFGRTYRSNMGL